MTRRRPNASPSREIAEGPAASDRSQDWGPFLKRVVVLGAAGSIVVALMGLLGYVPGLGLLGSVREGYIPMAPSTESSSANEQRGSPPDSADLRYIAGLEQAGLPSTDPVGFCREWMMRQMLKPMMGRPEAASRTQMDPCLYWNEWPSQLFPTIRRVIPQMMGTDWDYSDRAALVQAPVLTIHGTDDPNAPGEGGRDWATLLPNARLSELEGVGHGPWLEAPDEFFRSVDAFLQGEVTVEWGVNAVVGGSDTPMKLSAPFVHKEVIEL